MGSLDGMTLSMWLKTASTETNRYLFGGWNEGPRVQFTFGTGVANKINAYHSSMPGRISSVTSVNDGNWHHVAWRYVKNGTFKIYIDGVEEASTSCGEINWNSWYCITNAAGSNKLNGMNGNFDDVRIYSYALSSAEILGIYNN